jgi:hypothetical protein
VGSAVNDSTRLLGGTLGVAVIGSVYASLYSTRLDTTIPDTLPHPLRDLVRDSIGGAYGVASQLAAQGQTSAANLVHQASTSAFDHGVAVGCVVAGVVAIAGALLSAAFLPAQPPTAASGTDDSVEAQLARPATGRT